MRKAVYPGSFDPVTYGHLDLIERGSKLFDELIVAVGTNPRKAAIFSVEERISMIQELVKDLPNVKVEAFTGMAVEFVKSRGAEVILRGIRTVSDFEYEFQMALTNQVFAPDIETVFIMASQNYSFFSASLIKEAVTLGGDASKFVPPIVEKKLREKLHG